MNVLFFVCFFFFYGLCHQGFVGFLKKKKKKKTYKRGGTSLVYVIYTRTDRLNGSWKST